MDDSLLFSVVIPLYNKADTILRTLHSVEAQSFREFELIVVDDGSLDEGVCLVESYQMTIPLRIVRQMNAGVSAARNRGVAEARGRYVAFLDADDEWNPDFLRELARILEKYPDANVIGTDYEYASEDNIVSGLDKELIEEIDFFEEWPWRTPINSSSAAIRRSFYQEHGGYNEKFKYYEDAEFLFRLALVSKFHVSRRVLARYNSDANYRATGKSFKATSYPHWIAVEGMMERGCAPSNVVKCLAVDFGRILYYYARKFRIEEVVELKITFPNIFSSKRWWALLSNKVGVCFAMPLLALNVLHIKLLSRKRYKIRKR